MRTAFFMAEIPLFQPVSESLPDQSADYIFAAHQKRHGAECQAVSGELVVADVVHSSCHPVWKEGALNMMRYSFIFTSTP